MKHPCIASTDIYGQNIVYGCSIRPLKKNLVRMKQLLKIFFIFTIVSLHTSICYSQDDDIVQNIVGRMVEIWAENEIPEEEIEQMSEELFSLSESPISLNDVNLTPLVDVHLLTEYQIAVIKKYIRQHGYIQTIWELSMMPEFTSEDLKLLSPFVSVYVPESKKTIKDILRYPKNEIISEYKRNIEKADGYYPKIDKPAAYQGTPDKFYLRYMVKSKRDFSMGITAKKDPGETFFKTPRNDGFDYYSAHVYIKLDRFVKEMAIGDYTIGFANGLTAGYGIMSGKNSQAVSIKQNSSRIRKYSGASEFGFMRGVATSLQYKNISSIIFLSHKEVDATITSDTITGLSYITSLPRTGYHRTENELKQRKAAQQNVVGANLQFASETFKIGLNSVAVKYNYPILHNYALYRIFEPNTDLFYNFSADYQYMNRGVLMWGEAATDKNRNLAFMQGIHFKTSDISQLALLYRNYSPEYYSPLALAFGNSDDGSNEEGLYLGMILYPVSSLEINAYADIFRYPWMRFRRSSPTQGYDYMVDMRWAYNRNMRISARFRMKDTFYDITSDTITTRLLDNENIIRCHLQSDIDFTKYLSSQTRIASTFFDNYNGKQTGWMMYQELTYKLLKTPLRLSARYAIFNTDSYDTRIYAYEKDVLYAFSIPALYSTGTRYYLVASWKISRNMAVYAKWSQSIWSNTDELGSGNDRIDGNKRSQFTIKIKAQF